MDSFSSPSPCWRPCGVLSPQCDSDYENAANHHVDCVAHEEWLPGVVRRYWDEVWRILDVIGKRQAALVLLRQWLRHDHHRYGGGRTAHLKTAKSHSLCQRRTSRSFSM
jgi:hypothetical protein